jgi:hypothetical protein
MTIALVGGKRWDRVPAAVTLGTSCPLGRRLHESTSSLKCLCTTNIANLLLHFEWGQWKIEQPGVEHLCLVACLCEYEEQRICFSLLWTGTVLTLHRPLRLQSIASKKANCFFCFKICPCALQGECPDGGDGLFTNKNVHSAVEARTQGVFCLYTKQCVIEHTGMRLMKFVWTYVILTRVKLSPPVWHSQWLFSVIRHTYFS